MTDLTEDQALTHIYEPTLLTSDTQCLSENKLNPVNHL